MGRGIMDRGQGGGPCPGEKVITHVIRVMDGRSLGVRMVGGGGGSAVQFGGDGVG